MNLPALIKTHALSLDFMACGISDLSPTPHGIELDRWIAAGYGGVMRYLNRQARKRKDPSRIDSRARSAVVVIDNYYYPDSTERRFKIARYARGRDYHLVTMDRLELLAQRLRDLGAGWTRPFADAGPVPERELGMRSGLGWIGKNTMLIRPGFGSWFVIGSVFSDLELEPDSPFKEDHCGSCTRCLDACPTQAFVEPRMLDATKCLSYQTIEQKGRIPEDLAHEMNGWIFGCDICNEVCPWNERFARESRVEEFRPRQTIDLDDASCFAHMDDAEFSAAFADTPLARPGLERMRRNVLAAAAASTGDRPRESDSSLRGDPAGRNLWTLRPLDPPE